jgi:hypothetical protein
MSDYNDKIRLRAKLSSRDAFALIRSLYRDDRVAASEMIDALDPEECAWVTASLARTAAMWAEAVAEIHGDTVEGLIDMYLTQLDRT